MTERRVGAGYTGDARIVILQPAFLGDAVLASALVASWHRKYPTHRLALLVRKEATGLFQGHPLLDTVLEWDRSGAGKYFRLISLAWQLRKWAPDVVVNLHRYGSMALLARISGAQVVRSFGRTAAPSPEGRHVRFPHALGDGRHETQRNHQLVEALIGPWSAEDDRPALHPQRDATALADTWPNGAAILAPASVWETKRWPAEHWAALADRMAAEHPDMPVILLGGPGDAGLLEAVRGKCRQASPLLCAGALPLLSAAALMGKSTVVVSNDSAPLHMAGAVGAPVVGVFCSTTPRLGFGVLPGMKKAGRAADVEIPEAQLACKPCGPHGHRKCPLGHFKCGGDLEVERVWAAVKQVSSLPS